MSEACRKGLAALQAEVKTRQEVVDQKEAQVSKHNPAIFQKLQQARGVGVCVLRDFFLDRHPHAHASHAISSASLFLYFAGAARATSDAPRPSAS